MFDGMKFKLGTKHLILSPTRSICINHVAAASIIKQYVKAKFPDVLVSTASESYSMGCSARAYISHKDGRGINKSAYDDVRNFAKKFQMGNFNGMTDSYEYNADTLSTDSGMHIDAYTKYISVENEPKFGTVAHIMNSIKERTSISSQYAGGAVSLDQAIKDCSSFASDKIIQTAVAELEKL